MLLSCVAPAQEGGKKLRFTSIEHDFGKVKQGTVCEYPFEFTNVSRDTILLNQPKASCGCTAALMSTDVVFPGKKGTISVRYTAQLGVNGPVSKSVSVTMQPGEIPLETLTINARVEGDVRAEGGMLRFDAEPGETKTLTVRLTSTSERTVALDNISASLMEYRDTSASDIYRAEKTIPRPFTNFAMSTSKQTLQPADSCTLKLVLSAEHKGQINGSIRIATGGTETLIPVAGVVLPRKTGKPIH